MSMVRERPLGSILVVGHVCSDIIVECSAYPSEDDKVMTNSKPNKCIDQRWQRGGNAGNSCTILGLLGARPYFCGTVADSFDKNFILDDFARYDINTENVVIHGNCESPMSYVVLSAATGSRTIIHSNKNLPEITIEDFAKIDLQNFKWIHFEGRNITNVCKMISLVREFNKSRAEDARITMSVELEKAKPELEQLIPLPDVLFVSKDYAAFKGYSSMEETIENLRPLIYPSALVICPWGEAGASASSVEGPVVQSPSYPPPKVIDTLGAGDTFNAATIFALCSGYSPRESISFGCKVAGEKVGVKGWESFREYVPDLLPALGSDEMRGTACRT